MVKLEIRNLWGRILEISANDLERSLLGHFQGARMDWMHACGGKGRCTTCKVTIVEGAENFQPLTEAEQRYRQRGMLKEGERLSCQARITGNATVAVPPESMLPHIKYGTSPAGTGNNAGG